MKVFLQFIISTCLLIAGNVLAALSFEPATPVIKAGESVSIQVQGAGDSILWNPTLGSIAGIGERVTYTAPAQVGIDAIAVISGIEVGVLKITVVPTSSNDNFIALDKAQWRNFANRSDIQASSKTSDGKILWLGTRGGLEQRDAATGRLLQIFNRLNGLPSPQIQALAPDEGNGVWAGTNAGLAHFDGSQWATYTSVQGLPGNDIKTLSSDNAGGVWLSSFGGTLAHISATGDITPVDVPALSAGDEIRAILVDAQANLWLGSNRGLLRRDSAGQWGQLNSSSSELPHDTINALLADGKGDLWLGTRGGLARLDAAGQWQVWTQDNTGENMGLPDNEVLSLENGYQGVIWIGTADMGVVRFDGEQDWLILNTDNSDLPNNRVNVLIVSPQIFSPLWIGTTNGLAGLQKNRWLVQEGDNAGLPGNRVQALAADDEGGIWIGTFGGSLVYRDANGDWVLYNTENSELPDGFIQALAHDGKNLWIGTGFGLARVNESGTWKVYTPNNSDLPQQSILSLQVLGDTLWVGTENGGLARFQNNTWTVYNTRNSELPDDQVDVIVTDNSGGIWIGSERLGLAYLGNDGQWQVFDKSNSALPGNRIYALRHNHQGLWIGTDGGLLNLAENQQWQVFTTENSELPGNRVYALSHDGNGGLWIGSGGVASGGLAHFSKNEEWTVFTTANSGLPDNTVSSLQNDSTGNLWIGTEQGGLALLEFGQRRQLSSLVSNSTLQDQLYTDKRAALIFHPNGMGVGYNQAEAVDFMARYTYQTLYARGYDHDEIYFLSYRPDMDINQDGQTDVNVVDAPVDWQNWQAGTAARDLSLEDITQAFDWAKEQGTLEQPLLLFFIDHGLPDHLLLEPTGLQLLDETTFAGLLDDYQNVTGNTVIVVLEACHTGSLVSALQAENRIIITSTDDDLAYYDDLGRTSFMRSFMDQMRLGDSFMSAWQMVSADIQQQRSPLNRQQPQLEDSSNGILAQQFCMNGCFGSLPGLLTMTVEPPPAVVEPGQTVELSVETNIAGGSVNRVWASVSTPETSSQITDQGYARQSSPITYLRRADDTHWNGVFDEFGLNGEYQISVKAEDNTGFVTDAPAVMVSVSSGSSLQTSSLDMLSNPMRISLPVLAVPVSLEQEVFYQLDLLLSSMEPLQFTVDLGSLVEITETSGSSHAYFEAATGLVQIPLLAVDDGLGGMVHYQITMQVIQSSPEIILSVESISLS
ncbi:ligand-binding sensor domain-containing protein [Candidatus Venteria ishoeyi]|uniref:Two component regulator propeller n=1 Tax=Candidatus Venteria ishoeyi TaxID=1899563 RepID=A0A1H6FCJ8_9GAMM|nr:two-component regulator propeller domain-containing protein [Candidatus Venteria ishoeyi]SEH07812.1 Two component regulator propeller [Candidatus Venteria ishoeyi]